MPTLILYVFHQENENLHLFIQRALISDPQYQYIFIYNTNTPPEKDFWGRWHFLYDYPNINLFIRPNIGHDFQAWNEALFLKDKNLKSKIIKEIEDEGIPIHIQFDRFIFLNNTVAGPYIPLYIKENWIESFLSKLDTDVKMVGITANFMGGTAEPSVTSILRNYYKIESTDHTHIQSMIFGLDREGLDILISYTLFHDHKQFPSDKWTLICSSEIGMSVLLRKHQKSLFAYRIGQGLIPPSRQDKSNDLWYIDDHPLCETMFVKTNTRIPTFNCKNRYDLSK